MTTVDKHHIVNSHSSVSAIQVIDNDSSIKPSDGKVIVDEEIDSCEGEDFDEKMFRVALVNSVMDTGGNGNGNDEALHQASGDMSPRSKARCALRKRRRPGDEVTAGAPLGAARLVSGTLVKSESYTASNILELPNDPLNELQHVQDNGVASISIPSIQLPLSIPIQIKQELLHHLPAPSPTYSTIKIEQEPQQQQNIGVTARGHSRLGIISKPPSSSPVLLPSIALSAPQRTLTNNMAFSAKPPNIKKKASRKRKVKPPKVTAKTKVAERLSIPVPNPLLANASPTHQSLNHSILRGRQDAILISTSLVPCPLSVPSPLDAASFTEIAQPEVTTSYISPFDPSTLTKVSENSAIELPVQTRARVFSVDLDPSTFDFSDLSSITGGNSDNKASADSDLPIFQGRDRAFSFEVFNFAGDDLLPNPVLSSSMLQAPSLAPVNVEAPTRRPRGDSIIFDPASFQDGGIHEKNALEKARLKDLVPIAPPHQSLSHHTNQRRAPAPSGVGITGTYSTIQSSNLLPLLLPPGPTLNRVTPLVAGQNRVSKSGTGRKARRTPHSTTGGSRVTSSNRTNSIHIATLPSSLSAGASNAQTPPTFQMELLNKDGRIGIYLPEARRFRIARFHAKRKMRIWRKRIKYDCRKKLADSRPRIKGRFVKRSDMD